MSSAEHLAALAYRLTDRDLWLLSMVREHRVFAADQISRAAFVSANAGRRRVRELYQWSVLDRFHPSRSHGNLPLHYVLGPAGAAVLAAEHGIEVKNLGYRREQAMSIAYSPRLAHLLGLNDWFVALIRAATDDTDGASRLRAWWSETRCARYFGDAVNPDGYGRWRGPDTGEIEFFLEYDRGTEDTSRVARKLEGYASLAASTGIATPVLVWLPTSARESTVRARMESLRRSLKQPQLVPVATAAADLLAPDNPAASPADPLWLPLPTRSTSLRGRRHRLHELRHAWPQLTPPGTPTEAESPTAAPRRGMLPAVPPMPPPASPTTSQNRDSSRG